MSHPLAQSYRRSHDRWVVPLVVVLLAALILGFAASAPAFEPRGPDATGASTPDEPERETTWLTPSAHEKEFDNERQ